MRKMLISCCLLVVSLLLIGAFATSTSYTQLVIATLFYPPIAYLVFKSFPKKTGVIKKNDSTPEGIESVIVEEESSDILDFDKRAFIKLIGAAGFSFFLFSLFAKRSEALFFGKVAESGVMSIEDKNGNKIDPAEKQPTDGYQITEIDEGDVIYCGYTNQKGGWYIMKQDLDSGSFRYTKGDSDFPGNWDKRDSLKYDYFSNAFA